MPRVSPPARSLRLAALLLLASCGGSHAVNSPDANSDMHEAPVIVEDDASDVPPEEAGDDRDDGDSRPVDDGGDTSEAEVQTLDAGADADAQTVTTTIDATSIDATVEDGGALAMDATGDVAADGSAPSDDAAASDASLDASVSDGNVADANVADANVADANVVDASVRDAAGDWTCFGKDLANTRFNAAETTLSRANVANLTLAWQRPAPGISATPAVVGNNAFWADWQGGVQATRISDGALSWSRSFTPGFTSSPCISQDTVYVGDRFNTLYALDRETGATRWATQVNGVALTHLWSSPVIADGVLVIGISADGTNADRQPLPADQINTFRGAVVGVDAATGALLWRFETTRVIGEPADRYGAGVSVWSSAAVDLARGLIFIGTGNSYGAPASPYSDALLALRFRTGELAWSVQFTPNDAYSGANPSGGPDYDIGAAPNLFSIDTAGAAREVVGVGDKAGRYRVLDRDSGALVWERQLDPGFNLSGRKTGGVIAPAAVAYGRIFVASNTSWHDSRVWALNANNGEIVWTSDTIDSVNFGGPAVANGVVFFGGSGFRVDEDPPDSIGVGRAGDLIAFAADTGTVLFRTKLYAGRGAGFSVSQGHVFVGTGFTFYGYSDEPVDGALQAFSVP
jgi:polyvinyl alcohol dehydrogenase (cytochrome)